LTVEQLSKPSVLSVAAEAFPLIKTGGLADVVGALPTKNGDLHGAPDEERVSHVPRRHQKRIARELVAVLHANSLAAAKRNLRSFRLRFAKQFHEVVACLERGFADATTVHAFNKITDLTPDLVRGTADNGQMSS